MCFNVKTGIGFAFVAEIIVVIYALELAQARGLNYIWLESDSVYVVVLLRDHLTKIPWHVKARWWRCVLAYIAQINFRVTHTFREGMQFQTCSRHQKRNQTFGFQ